MTPTDLPAATARGRRIPPARSRRCRGARLPLLLWALLSLGACAGLTPLTGPGAQSDPDQAAVDTRALAAHLAQVDHAEDDAGAYYRPWVAVLPFVDDSGFKEGVWDLRNGPAAFLSRRMAPSPAWRVVPYEAVRAAVHTTLGKAPREWRPDHVAAVAGTLHVDLVVTARLLNYNMERLEVGDPMLGGYKSYRGVAEVEAQAQRVPDGAGLGAVHADEEVVDRGLGIDLLGKPREQDTQFVNLHLMDYGGQEFLGTAIGQATQAALDRIVEQLAESVRPRAIDVAAGTARILSVFGDEVFINVGSGNGVHVGYRFAVYPGPGRGPDMPVSERLGVVEVTQIVGAGVSKVSAVSGGARIGVGDRLELVGLEAGEGE